MLVWNYCVCKTYSQAQKTVNGMKVQKKEKKNLANLGGMRCHCKKEEIMK